MLGDRYLRPQGEWFWRIQQQKKTKQKKNKESKDYKRLLFCVVTINDNIQNLGSKEILQVKGPHNAR